jgi:hypothetical protein
MDSVDVSFALSWHSRLSTSVRCEYPWLYHNNSNTKNTMGGRMHWGHGKKNPKQDHSHISMNQDCVCLLRLDILVFKENLAQNLATDLEIVYNMTYWGKKGQLHGMWRLMKFVYEEGFLHIPLDNRIGERRPSVDQGGSHPVQNDQTNIRPVACQTKIKWWINDGRKCNVPVPYDDDSGFGNCFGDIGMDEIATSCYEREWIQT